MLKKDSRGLAPVMIIVAIVVVAAVAGAAFMVMGKSKKTDNSQSTDTKLSSSEKKAIEAECKKEIDDKDFCKFASAGFIAPSESHKVTMTNTQGSEVSTTVMEQESTSKYRMTTTTNGKESMAFVSIDNATYTKDATDGKWLKITSTPTETKPEDTTSPDFKLEDDPATPEKDNIEYKNLGKEDCGSLKCFKYQIIDPTDKTTLEQFVWFDDKSYILRRWMNKTADGSTDAVYSYEKVTITEPSPVKEMPNIDTMTPEQIEAYMNSLGM